MFLCARVLAHNVKLYLTTCSRNLGFVFTTFVVHSETVGGRYVVQTFCNFYDNIRSLWELKKRCHEIILSEFMQLNPHQARGDVLSNRPRS